MERLEQTSSICHHANGEASILRPTCLPQPTMVNSHDDGWNRISVSEEPIDKGYGSGHSFASPDSNASKRQRVSRPSSSLNVLRPKTPLLALRNYIRHEITPITTEIGEKLLPPLHNVVLDGTPVNRDLEVEFASVVPNLNLIVPHPGNGGTMVQPIPHLDLNCTPITSFVPNHELVLPPISAVRGVLQPPIHHFDLNCTPISSDPADELRGPVPNQASVVPADSIIGQMQLPSLYDERLNCMNQTSTNLNNPVSSPIYPPTALATEILDPPLNHIILPQSDRIPLHEQVEVENRYPTAANATCHFLGEMNVECTECGALHWMDEKLANSSLTRPLFGTCCLQGKVKLPLLNTPPEPIQALYDGNDEKSRSFRGHIREYNACHAFTSLGVKFDDRLIRGRGPKPFTIHGELRHRTGSLLPVPGREPMYAQLYIYDPHSALQIRCRTNQERLRDDVIEIIQDTLLQHNPFPQKFRQAFAILQQQENSPQHLPALLHYSAATDRRRYNLPTTDEIAVILPGDGTEQSGLRDIVLHLNGDNSLMRINECHPAYLPLHYVLLFPRGELGWDPSYRQWSIVNNSPSTDRLTQMQFYSYRLFQRHSEYSTILRGGRLLQEFLVDAWASTEQNHLTYFRLNQLELRAESCKDFMEVTVRNGVGPNQVG